MTYFLLFGAVVMAAIYLLTLYLRGDIRGLVRVLRFVLGYGALGLALILLFARQVGAAGMLMLVAFPVIIRGRFGPLDFTNATPSEGGRSKVRSQFFEMALDHETGGVSGRVIAGLFVGTKLIDLGEDDMRTLLAEVARDADSMSLLETWLDANRVGWREHLGVDGSAKDAKSTAGPLDRRQAYEILGLDEGADDAEIKAAHHRLMKRVHPDQGGSTFLAARINEAKDLLLKP